MSHFEQALAMNREAGNRRMEGIVLGNLGNACLDQGRLDAAGIRFTEALDIHREVGNRRDEAIALANLGRLRRAQRRSAEAHELYEAALTIAREARLSSASRDTSCCRLADELHDEERIAGGAGAMRTGTGRPARRAQRPARRRRAEPAGRPAGPAWALRRSAREPAGRRGDPAEGGRSGMRWCACSARAGMPKPRRAAPGAAREALDAAEALAAASGVPPESEPGRALAAAAAVALAQRPEPAGITGRTP